MSRRPLFVYGTLRSPAVRRALYGGHVPVSSATLQDHAVGVAPGEGAWLTLVSTKGAVVDGELLDLTDAQLWRTDQWEGIPLYERRVTEVKTASGPVEAYVYVHHLPGRLGSKGTAAVPVEQVEREMATTELDGAVRCDVYILLPCLSETTDRLAPAGPVPQVVAALQDITRREFQAHVSDALRIGPGGLVRILVNGSDEQSRELVCKADAQAMIVRHAGAATASVTLCLPAFCAPPALLLDQVSRGALAVEIGGVERPIDAWLDSLGLSLAGTPRTVVCFAEAPSRSALTQVLAGETKWKSPPTAGVVTEPRDLSQYGGARIYATRRSVAEVSEALGHRWERRFEHRHGLTLFILQLLNLQEAALVRATRQLGVRLERMDEHRSSSEIQAILEGHAADVARVRALFSGGAYRYELAERLAGELAQAYGLADLDAACERARADLREVLDLRAQRLAAHDGVAMGAALAILAVLQTASAFQSTVVTVLAACVFGSLLVWWLVVRASMIRGARGVARRGTAT